MLIPRFGVWMFSFGMMFVGAGLVSGQNYPNKPIRIVTANPGGANDLTARLISPGLSVSLGQQVTVDNRGGASGAIAAEIVARAPPDGYTLLLYSGTFWIAPLLRDHGRYDPVKDFSPITLAVTTPIILVVHPSLPANSVKGLIALARARPAEINLASTSTGSSAHLAAELFKVMAGINMLSISYKGSGQALIDLVAGQVQVMFPVASAVAPYVKSGRLRALAVTSAKPSALVPGLPTVAASGLAGYEYVSMQGVFAPARTPAVLIDRLNQEIVRVLRRPDVKEKFFNVGVETVGSSPQELGALMQAEMVRVGKVIKGAGIRAD